MRSTTVTVAILAQGTHWAVAVVQAFSHFPIGPMGTATLYAHAHVAHIMNSCIALDHRQQPSSTTLVAPRAKHDTATHQLNAPRTVPGRMNLNTCM